MKVRAFCSLASPLLQQRDEGHRLRKGVLVHRILRVLLMRVTPCRLSRYDGYWCGREAICQGTRMSRESLSRTVGRSV
jgi:hypothetical protein